MTHTILESTLRYFRERKPFGERLQGEWHDMIGRYTVAHQGLAAEFDQRRAGTLGTEHSRALTEIDTTKFRGQATRDVNGALIEKVWPICRALCGGGADLVNSNKVYYDEADIFHPLTGFVGLYVRYGI